ncbi:glutamate ABC transporter substrate-binding protein [Streptomyces sp. PSKA30]|uniref:glutamate ABC transporter substrate-binding protein n=1 Tax=Streptomyces sp. PSKA30 TaxID=2874597 RepID=UPI001CD0DF67|nr:glutamate ABC transporter substrate-binding protein [Streptomyces sp. PSKA30]MBZ9640469.1 glutamate ABC transporter substrate-binding protein [Streptomyces sp. PSKA30]
MHARRLRASLKGWGGVGAMAVVCALAVAFALLLPHTRPAGDGSTGVGGQGVADGSHAKAEECKNPEDQSLSPSTAEGASIATIKKRGYVSVGVDQNSYRWGYRNPNSTAKDVELEGFDIDLARRIAEDLLGDADRIRFKAIPTNQRIPAIQSGQVDMVVRTMTINCDRLEQVAFSAPYFLTGQQVLAPTSSTIEGYDETLADQKICSAKGSTAYDKLDADRKAGRLPASTDISITVPNQLDCLVRLQLGQVDAVVTDGALAASQAAQDPTVELKGDRFTTEYYGVAMKKDADDLVRRVNRILEDYREDGGWKRSYGTWLSATLGSDSESATPPRPTYA